MLRSLSGRAHQVLTGLAVRGGHGVESRVVISTVRFRQLTEAEIAWYVQTGEGADKAGGYALQGRAGAFITSVEGSPSNVIGLPLADTVELLRRAGLEVCGV
jgi:septum formation protein